MNLDRLDLKLYAQDAPPAAALIPVFHRWISDGTLDEIWVDVADYRHVPRGPGVLLVAHHAHYGWDAADGAWGLRVRHRRARNGRGPTPVAMLLADVLDRTLRAAATLARDPELAPLGWRTDRWTLEVPDRLHAPRGPVTLRELERAVRDVFTERVPGRVERVEPVGDAVGPAALRVHVDPAPTFADTLAHAG